MPETRTRSFCFLIALNLHCQDIHQFFRINLLDFFFSIESQSELSDFEGRIRALNEELRKRKTEADKLKRERKKKKKELMKNKEETLKKQIEVLLMVI